MKFFWKCTGWAFSGVLVLAFAAWLLDKNDIQTFWVFVLLWLMQYIHNIRHEELMKKIQSMQEKLDAIAKT
jgi:hypothetical protein